MKSGYCFFIVLVLTGISITSCSLFNNNDLNGELVGEWEQVAQKIGGEQVPLDSLNMSKQTLRFDAAGGYAEFRADTLHDSGRYFIFERRGNELLGIESDRNKREMEFTFTFLSKNRLRLMFICPNCSVIPLIYERTSR